MTAEMLTAVRNALAADVELVSWCVEKFGQPPTIQIDFDEEASIDADSYPFIGILAVAHHTAINAPEQGWTIPMLAAVRKPGVTVSSASLDIGADEAVSVPLRTYEGRGLAETLREKALAALFRGRIGKITVAGDDMSHTYHPRFFSPFTINVTTQQQRR